MLGKLLIVTNVDWFLISHRLVIAKAAVKAGWKVYVACENTGRASEISVDGVEYIPISFSRSGLNFLKEVSAISKFYRLYKAIEPDVVHHITLKPVVYGSFIARQLGIKGVVNAITGLGYSFTAGRDRFVQRAILKFLKFGLARFNAVVIFQNEDDRNLLANLRVLSPLNQIVIIKGAGVDLKKYAYSYLPETKPRIRVLLPCRMLWDKGVMELYEATQLMKAKYSETVSFLLAGIADHNNRAAVSEEFLRNWEDGEYVRWIGHQESMEEIYRDCHIVVLPSYREGLPKTLIEACAIGRPIVTTDAIGCKDCVDEGINGFKVPVGDAGALVLALETLINNPTVMEAMGKAGRAKAETEFDVDSVVRKHLEIYQSLL